VGERILIKDKGEIVFVLQSADCDDIWHVEVKAPYIINLTAK